MEVDSASRYRSRILREMNANRENPFNSPPSSTGSHGTVSPTISSVFTDPDGESTRRLNEDIARITSAPKSLPVNWEAAHRKWPEFFGMPKSHSVPVLDDNTDTRPMSAESKENKTPALSAKFMEDSTQETWMGSNRTRAEMQPRVDNESDLSSILSKSPARILSNPAFKLNRNPSPLSKVQMRVVSESTKEHFQRQESLSDALERLRNASQTPKRTEQEMAGDRPSPQMSSAKSSLTAVARSPASAGSPEHNQTANGRSFFMPDVSHLGDFVTGTLRFTGSMQNGVPIFVKHGRVHDRQDQKSPNHHAEVDGIEVPEEEEKIFVSMDMIREEIVSLQDHYDKVQEYAMNLQEEVEQLEEQLKARKNTDNGFTSYQIHEHLATQKTRLEMEVAELQSKLEQASRKTSLNAIENDSLAQERDRAVRKLQEACEDINKLTRKLSTKEKELETTHRQLESTDQLRNNNDTLRRDLMSLKHGRDSLELENTSLQAENRTLRAENETLKEEIELLRSNGNKTRDDHTSLITENRSLRASNKVLMEENEELREGLDGVQHELDASREEIETLRQEVQTIGQEKTTLREDNESLVRHNEKYFSENKVLRRENSGFERTVHDLHDDNVKLKEEVEFLKQQLDHCRPAPKEDYTVQIDDDMDENMTSAFFIPDITMNTNDTNQIEATETKDLPELTAMSTKLPVLPEVTEQQTRNTTKFETTSHTQTREVQLKAHRRNKSSTSKAAGHSQRVAFSIPEKEKTQKNSSNVANQGSKRRNASRTSSKAISITDFEEFDDDNDDTTGPQSVNDTTTQDFSMQLDVAPKVRRESKSREQRHPVSEITGHSQKSRASQKHTTVMSEMTVDSVRSVDKDTCPVLSNDARRVLDDLCEHSCRNCTVCSRITSHKGIFTSADFAAGKKRVTVPRPVPVTDRNLSVEDPTMRPLQSPGHALAMVIKGLEDESRHLQLELTRIQARYNSHDKALGRRERLSIAEAIRTMLKRLEAKNDQIYSLYDVLEGQKAAGQAMSEEEIEMTVLNITGMTVRDVTSGSEQLTWEGIPDI